MIAYPQSIDFHFYRSYHQDPYNKAIHLICIPMLSLCFLNFASIIKADRALLLFYSVYYLSLSLKVGIVMTIYLIGLYKFAKSFRFVVPNWREYTFKLFIFAWIFQFFGHFIEGNRPALLTGIKQAFLEAPLFTMEYVYPSLLDSL
tara:strand:+ start:405 stop:842 length:438 start_codon:yes stop_codon:yes gene_type:complete